MEIQHRKFEIRVSVHRDEKGKSRSLRETIEVMVDGEDAGVVFEALFHQDLECPLRFIRNRITGGTVAYHFVSCDIFEDGLSFFNVFSEFFLCLGIDQFMGITMTGDLVALFLDCSDEMGISLGEPAQDEEGCSCRIADCGMRNAE